MKSRNKILIVSAILLVVITGIGAINIYPTYRLFTNTDIIKFDKNLRFIIGGGGNSGILITDSAIVVIDTKMGETAEKLHTMVNETAGKKKVIVINTHYHMDHVGGNNLYKGAKIYIGNYSKEFLQKNVNPEFMPTNFVPDSLILNMGNETLILYNVGQAHTYNDMVVYLKKRKLLFSGDLIFYKVNPVLKKESGADVDKWITVLNNLQNKWKINTIIPGHGQSGGKELLVSMKQYFEDMKLASTNPDKEKEIFSKYENWKTIPDMASPEFTIDYIKGK